MHIRRALLTILFSLFSTVIGGNCLAAEIISSQQITPFPVPLEKTLLQPSAGEEPGTPGGAEPADMEAPPKEEPSEFELYISGKTGLTDIRQYGYALFQRPPSSFAPVENIPVGPGYIIGPGDEVRVAIWGKVEGQWSVEVDRDGNISLPKVGVLGVAGLTFQELKKLLHKEFSRYYTGFEMNVSMGALRTLRVYVVGNAGKPGAYTISSLSTLVNALFASGGPSKTGTMRDIQLKRNGKTVTHMDLYDFLLQGDKSGDMRLLPEDVIFIPSIGPVAGVVGDVKNPAIYELRGQTRVLDLIDMAGGLSSIAFKGRVQVQRIKDHSYGTVFESDLADVEGNPEKNFVIMDGDLVRLFSVPEMKTIMIINGAVANPGEYAITPGRTRLEEVLSRAGGLHYYASETGELTRVRPTPDGPVTEMFTLDLTKALSGDPSHNMTLEENDYLFVRTVPEWRLYEKVTISGEVRFPGTYTITKGERLSSLIQRAGGFTDNAFLRGAVFTRESVRELQQKQIDAMVERLEKELLGISAAEVGAALSADEARIQQLEARQKQAFVDSLRKVRAQGRMVVSLSPPEQMEGTQYDIVLQAGDTLSIPETPHSVQVIGSVYTQTAFIYDSSKSYSDYIGLTGGYTENADEKRVYILKVDGSAVKPETVWWKTTDMEPGDTIVVPEKLEKVAWMREFKDLTQILYQIAVTAGVLIVVF